MRCAALAILAILATCLCISTAPAIEIDQMTLIEFDDESGSSEGDEGGGDFYQTLMEYFYESDGRTAPGEPNEYPRPYDPEPCGDDEDCVDPGDFYLPTCNSEYCG
jgi:hypothetical protein